MGQKDAKYVISEEERDRFLKYSIEQFAASTTYKKAQKQLQGFEAASQMDNVAIFAEREAYAHALQAVAFINNLPVPAPLSILMLLPERMIEIDEHTITSDTFLSAAAKIIFDNLNRQKRVAQKMMIAIRINST